MHATLELRETPSLVDEVHWAKVFEQRMDIKKVLRGEPSSELRRIADLSIEELETEVKTERAGAT